MDAAERELFAKSLGHATAQHTNEALDAALADLGWHDALAADARVAVPALFEQQGAANATSSALDRVVVAALGPSGPAGEVGVVLPTLGRCEPPGQPSPHGISVRGLGTSTLLRRDRAVVVVASLDAGDDAGDGVAAVVVATRDLALRDVRGIDPALGLVEATADGIPAAAASIETLVAWADAVAAGQRALAHELVGASRAMLDLARTHALERVQFGRPIAAFQAVRHRLADSYVAIDAANAAAAAAWDDPSPLAAALAKALAGRSARTVARHCQQVLAGIGFTTEHPFHRYVRRVHVLDRLLGDARTLSRTIGDDLLARGHLPAMLPL
jgi:Acyl-CoA dehydrogenase, C-terminal domain